MNLREELLQHFGYDIRKDVDLAEELYRALCNNIWRRGDDTLRLTWREAGEEVALIRTKSGCPVEDYSDFYLSGREGEVSPWVEARMSALGFKRE